ncbi:MAG TPA: hypothetical protein VGD37_43310 [Kofleriaceae bacterium]
MTPNRILEEDDLGSPVSSERPAVAPAGGKVLAAISRHRVLLGSCGIALVAMLAWQWTLWGQSAPVVPGAGPGVARGPERELEIIVLGVHDAVAAVDPVAAPGPPATVPLPAAASESVAPPIHPVSSPSRPGPTPRTAPGRAASSSAAKASPAPVAAAKSGPGPEPRVEIVPARPQPKPEGPPMETNPYVYK